jgi:hypothetical protein
MDRKYPMDKKRKSEPDLVWSIPISCSITGSSGEKITRETKFRKNRLLRNSIPLIADEKGGVALKISP